MIPHRAYVLLPRQIVSTLRGMRKYSTEAASANELGGTMQTSPVNSTNDFGSKCLGSTTAEGALAKILNSGAARMSYPEVDTHDDLTTSRTLTLTHESIVIWSSLL